MRRVHTGALADAAVLALTTGGCGNSGAPTEVLIMYVIGVLGFFMRRFDFPVAHSLRMRAAPASARYRPHGTGLAESTI